MKYNNENKLQQHATMQINLTDKILSKRSHSAYVIITFRESSTIVKMTQRS